MSNGSASPIRRRRRSIFLGLNGVPKLDCLSLLRTMASIFLQPLLFPGMEVAL